jgi:hypothetical protein
MTCPFCGVVTDVPHETQGACINALHAEIGRVRSILHRTEPRDTPGVSAKADDDPNCLTRPA